MSARAEPLSPSDRLAFVLASWFGCGLAPIAPGTVGTIGAVPLYLLVARGGAPAVAAAAAIVTAVGIWAASRVERRQGRKDPQMVCIDEAAGLLVTLIAAPRTAAGVIVGFLLFRLFDIVKPWPARRAERLPSGWGIVLDDLVAGGYGALVLVAARATGWM